MSFLKLMGAAVLASGFSLLAQAGDKIGGEVKVFNWIEYMPKEVLNDFTEKTGIKVSYDVYDSSQTLESRLLTGTSGYDVAFASSNQIPPLIKAGAVQELNKEHLPNLVNLDEGFMKIHDMIDPGAKHTVPYLWGTTLIVYNKQKVNQVLGEGVDMGDYDLIFKPENMKKLSKCGVAFLDSSAEIVPIALNYLGLDPNGNNPKDYDKAEELLLSVRPYIQYFSSSKSTQDLANGDICLAVAWSGNALIAKSAAKTANKGIEIEMALPKQGTLQWWDDMVIPAGARNVKQAEAFINYILEPEVIAKISNDLGYPNPNPKSLGSIESRLTENKNLFIPVEAQAKLFGVKPPVLKLQRLQTRMWNRVKTGA